MLKQVQHDEAIVTCELMKKGQSVIEIIIAIAIFMIIAGSTVVSIVGSLSISRLAEEESQATYIASEGIEAVYSIRNKDWESLADGSYGLDATSGEWVFAGTSDIDPSGKFTRQISISSVQRDINQDINTGVTDTETKQVVSLVSWDFTSARTNSVEMTAYVTNWQTDMKVTSCNDYCLNIDYSAGTCRNNSNQCISSGEENAVAADFYCGSPPATSCCCLP